MHYNVYVYELWRVSAQTFADKNWLWKIRRIFQVRTDQAIAYSIHEKAESPVSLKFTKTIKDMKTEPTAQPKLYIGIDIHKRSWKIHCATDLFSGKSFTMPPDPKVLEAYVSKHFSGYEVTTAYEAGCCGYYAHRSF